MIFCPALVNQEKPSPSLKVEATSSSSQMVTQVKSANSHYASIGHISISKVSPVRLVRKAAITALILKPA